MSVRRWKRWRREIEEIIKPVTHKNSKPKKGEHKTYFFEKNHVMRSDKLEVLCGDHEIKHFDSTLHVPYLRQNFYPL